MKILVSVIHMVVGGGMEGVFCQIRCQALTKGMAIFLEIFQESVTNPLCGPV